MQGPPVVSEVGILMSEKTVLFFSASEVFA